MTTAEKRIRKFHELNEAWMRQVEEAGFGDEDGHVLAASFSTAFEVYLLARVEGDSEEEARAAAEISLNELLAILRDEVDEAEVMARQPAMTSSTRGIA